MTSTATKFKTLIKTHSFIFPTPTRGSALMSILLSISPSLFQGLKFTFGSLNQQFP